MNTITGSRNVGSCTAITSLIEQLNLKNIGENFGILSLYCVKADIICISSLETAILIFPYPIKSGSIRNANSKNVDVAVRIVLPSRAEAEKKLGLDSRVPQIYLEHS